MRWVRCKTTSDYEPIILTPEQAFGLVESFPILKRTVTLLAAATALRISECLGRKLSSLIAGGPISGTCHKLMQPPWRPARFGGDRLLQI